MSEVSPAREVDHRWSEDEVPPSVTLGAGVAVIGAKAFARYFATAPGAMTVGEGSVMDGARFSVGPRARLRVGRRCRFSDAVVLVEELVTIGDRVYIGWGATIADADFHPLDPTLRRIDAEGCSPLDGAPTRPAAATAPVRIGNDVWIGPNATVLKGVRIGAGAFVEPGSVVTCDIPARARVMGNPARVTERF